MTPRRRRRGRAVGLVVLLALAGCASSEPYRRAPSDDDRRAGDALAGRMVEGLGGREAWDRLQVISFTFVVEAGVRVVARHHDWDKRLGLHKLTEGEGDDLVEVWTDQWSHDGVVQVGGRPVTDPERKRELIEDAWQAFINDTWWLVAPFKVFDDGTHRAAIDGDLRLTFDDGVGLTSGDAYLFDLDEAGHLLGWSFLLESGLRGSFDFRGEVKQHGVTFFTRKENAFATILLDGLEVSLAPRPEVFGPLAGRRPELAAPAAGAGSP